MTFVWLVAIVFTAGGCATVGGGSSRIKALEERVVALEQELGRGGRPVSHQTDAAVEDIVLDESIMRELEQDVTGKFRVVRTRRTGGTSVASVSKTKKNIQRALKNAGHYKGKVDGVLGKQSRRAIRSFQRANGLPADGICGTRTWDKLKKYL